jgi:hypothetical protein
MSIEKKSLISTLKSAKKANLANEISHDQTTRTAAAKAQPVVKFASKVRPVAKFASKVRPVAKFASKVKLVQKAAAKG